MCRAQGRPTRAEVEEMLDEELAQRDLAASETLGEILGRLAEPAGDAWKVMS
jgi:hypothetical protein